VTDLNRTFARIQAGATSLPGGTPGGTPGSGWVAPTSPTPPSAPGEAAAAITGTLVAEVLNDLDGDGQADPGDTVRYTLTIRNNGATAATGITLSDTLDPRMTLVSGSVDIGPLASNDSYTTVSGQPPLTVPAPGVLANDF